MAQAFDFSAFRYRCSQESQMGGVDFSPRLASLHAECEALLDGQHPRRSEHLDCRAGCGNCCIVNVSVLLPEALAIVEHLQGGVEQASEFMARLEQLWTAVRGLADEERDCLHQACVFLDPTESCSIYPLRPLLCRGVTSTDVEACRDSFNANLFNEQSGVRMNLFQRELYSAAYLGLSEGLEAQGLDGRGFELTGIVRYLLQNPQQHPLLKTGLRLEWSDLA